MDRILESLKKLTMFLGIWFLLCVFAPILGFTAILDIGYILDEQPIKALLWMFVFGPACLAGVLWLANRK